MYLNDICQVCGLPKGFVIHHSIIPPDTCQCPQQTTAFTVSAQFDYDEYKDGYFQCKKEMENDFLKGLIIGVLIGIISLLIGLF